MKPNSRSKRRRRVTSFYTVNSRNQLAQQVDTHIMKVQAWLSTRTPQAQRFEEGGLTATSSGLDVPLLNPVLGSNLPHNLPRHDIQKRIDTVKQFYAQRSNAWSWWVGPHANPTNIGQYLEENGLHAAKSRPAMVAKLPSPVSSVTNPNVRVWQVDSEADLETASTIRRTAFQFPEGKARNYFEAMAEDWLDGIRAKLFMAAHGEDGPPAAIGALIVANGMPGIYAMATLPQWERRGLGTAILKRLLNEATLAGHKYITLTASPQGYPLYCRLGFTPLFEYTIYHA